MKESEVDQAQKIILDAFYALFSGYAYSFDSSDSLIEKMGEGQRKEYYLQAKVLLENQVLRQEIKEWKRQLYAHLALKAMGDMECSAYRTTLLAVNKFEKRLNRLANSHTQAPLRNFADKL